VVTFLARHGVRSHSELLEGNDDSEELLGFLAAADADLVVSGAYGHSRLREWAFGGVTRSLLDTAKFNRFLSS
jgi:nucleotide-binding universal stress UspA family protein